MTLPLLLTVALTQYTADEANALFVEANDAYYRGDHDAATERYQRLLDAGRSGPDVLFNLGTTRLAAGDLGHAVLHLERAARLSDDDDIAANLGVARQRQGDQLVGSDDVQVPFTQRLAASLNETHVGIAFLVTWWLGFLMVWWASRSTSRLLPGLLAAALLFTGTLLGGALAVTTYVRRTVVEAVVMPPTLAVREYPGDGAKVAFEVHAGLKVRLMEESGAFVRIRLPNALEGWAGKDGVTPL